MCKKFFLVLCFFLALFTPSLALNQNKEETAVNKTKIEEFSGKLKAAIRAENNVEVLKSIIFDASISHFDQTKPATFTWNLGDGTIIEGEEIVHAYQHPGRYIVRLTLEQDEEKDHKEIFVYVYEKIIFLISNNRGEQESMYRFIDEARKNGIFINFIEDFTIAGATTEEALIKKLTENIEEIKKANTIIVWPEKTSDFSTLTSFYNDTKDKDIDYDKKTFIFVTEENLNHVASFSQSIFEIIKPQQIIITRKQALPTLTESENMKHFLEEIEKRLLDFSIVNEQSGRWLVLNLVSSLIQFMLQKGVPLSTIILILILPLIVSIVAFSRQVIGVQTFGVYTPAIITLSFIALGLTFGLTIFFAIIITGTIIRLLLTKFRLLYIPKVAIILTVSAFIIFLLMAVGAYYEIAELTTIAVFPMLIMTTLGEKFVTLQSGKGLKSAFLATLETTFVSVICYFIVTWQALQTAIISYPGWMFIIILLFNILIGKYTGLRISEYIRFREVFEHMEE